MNDPLLSIVLAIYNAEGDVEDALISILAQSFKHYEVLVIDGGSTDATAKIVEKYRSHLNYFVSERDTGLYDAWNKGIAASKGKLVTFLGADDRYLANAFAALADAHLANPYAILYSDVLLDYAELGMEVLHTSRIERSIGPGCGFQTFAYPRSCFETLGVFDAQLRNSADYEFYLRCTKIGFPFSKIGAPLLRFRYGGVSAKRYGLASVEALRAARKHGGMSKALALAPMLLKSIALHAALDCFGLIFGSRARRLLLRAHSAR